MYSSVLKDEASSVDKLQSVSLANRSLLQLSLSHENGCSVSRKFRHPCLRRLYFLLTSLVTEISAQFQSLRFVDNDSCHSVMQHFRWLEYFMRICRQPVGSRTSNECISDVAVHWQWLHRKLITSVTGIGFQFSPQLNEAMQHLQTSFGVDEVAMKIQCQVRTLLGHPHPFRSSSVADAFTEAYSLCCRLEGRSTDHGEAFDVTVRLRSDVQKMKLRLANSLMSLDEDSVESCVRETKDLLNILTTKHDVEEAELSTCIALFPVCQLLVEICETDFVTDICDYVTTLSREASQFISFCAQRTTVSPLTVCFFKSLLPSSVGEFCISRSLISRSIIMPYGALPRVYFGMLSCSASCQILSVLSAWDGSSNFCSVYSYIPGDFTVGDGDSRCSQMSGLGRLIWTNAQLLCGPRCDVYHNDCCLLLGVFRNLISSLQRLLPAELFVILDTVSAAGDMCVCASVSKRVLEMAATSSKLMMLIPDWPLQLSTCLQRIGQLHSADRCMNVATLGSAWVELGLFKMQFLAPRGPVDPSYRMAAKLEYAKEQLKNVEHSLKVHDWQAYLSTGGQLAADSHPMVGEMYRQQAQLQQWISDKSELVAYRPELARYLSLLHDVRQFMCGLGSAERIRDLVARLLSSLRCDIPTTSVVSEFVTLRAAVSAFVSRIEQDYLLYCDVVAPFLTAVAQTVHGLDLIVHVLHTVTSRHKLYSTLNCRPGMLYDFVRCLVQFPVTCENLKSGQWHTLSRVGFESLPVCFKNSATPSALQLRYDLDMCCDVRYLTRLPLLFVFFFRIFVMVPG